MVCRKSAASVGIEVKRRSPIADGAGRMIGGTPPRRTAASQRASRITPNTSGGARSERAREFMSETPSCGASDARQDRGYKQCRPDLHGLPVIGAREQARAEATVLALGNLSDDRADQRRRRADLH